MDPEELTEVARKCYDDEFAKRDLGTAEDEPELSGGHPPAPMMDVGEDWLQDAASACSFYDTPGPNTPDAEDARRVLEDAGIPCQIDTHEIEEKAQPRRTYHEFRVLVPGPLNLYATAVLDRDLFNLNQEEEWRAHLAALADDDLMALSPDMICLGLKDRIERLTRAYNDEVTRRSRGLVE